MDHIHIPVYCTYYPAFSSMGRYNGPHPTFGCRGSRQSYRIWELDHHQRIEYIRQASVATTLNLLTILCILPVYNHQIGWHSSADMRRRISLATASMSCHCNQNPHMFILSVLLYASEIGKRGAYHLPTSVVAHEASATDIGLLGIGWRLQPTSCDASLIKAAALRNIARLPDSGLAHQALLTSINLSAAGSSTEPGLEASRPSS